MRFLTLFTGHKASVLALAGDPNENYFYSVGADGLVVRWSVNKPDEGDVITRFNGIVASIVFEKESNVLYCALNQKGVVVLDCATGNEKGVVAIPSTSFTSIKFSGKYLMVSTKNGELILIDRVELKIIKRLDFALDKPIKFEIAAGLLWYVGEQGMNWVELSKDDIKPVHTNKSAQGVVLATIGANVVAFDDGVMRIYSPKKHRKSIIEIPMEEEVRLVMGGEKAPALIAFLDNGNLVTVKADKKSALVSSQIQNMHNGAINDLLWSENYKFVASAGADKTIGIWCFN